MIRFVVPVPRPYTMMNETHRQARKERRDRDIPAAFIGRDGRPCEESAALDFCFRVPTMADRIKITRECERIAAEIDTGYKQAGEAWANLTVHIAQINTAIRRQACAILKIPPLADMTRWADGDGDRYFELLDSIDDALLDAPEDDALLSLSRLMKHHAAVSGQIGLIEECAEWHVTQQIGDEWTHVDTCPAWNAYGDEVLEAWRMARRAYKLGFRQPSVS